MKRKRKEIRKKRRKSRSGKSDKSREKWIEGGREEKEEERKKEDKSTIFSEYLLKTWCAYIGLHSLFLFKKIFSDSK